MKDEGIFSKAELTGILSTNQIEIVCFRQYLWEESLTHFDFWHPNAHHQVYFE